MPSQARGRVASLVGDDGSPRWHTVEATAAVRALVEGVDVDGTTAEQAAAQVLRGHLEVASPLTHATWSSAPACRPAASPSRSPPSRRRASPSRGASASGPSTPETTRPRSSGRAVACSPACTPTRAPSDAGGSSRSAPSSSCASWCSGSTSPAPTQHRGVDGLARVIGQLQGYETAVGAWESAGPGPPGARLRPRLARPPLPPGRGHVAAAPTPVAGRSGSTPRRRHPHHPGVARAPRRPAVAARRPPRRDVPAGAGLRGGGRGGRGAHRARERASPASWRRATGRVLADVEAALWEGMARGLLVSDGFEPVRAVASGRRHAPPSAPRRARLRSGGLRPTETAGRWSLVPAAATDIDREELAEALADQLLERWGVVFYDLVAAEHPAVRWRDLQWALRRMEDRGLVAGGRFVRGFTGEQFALPQAAEALQAIRRAEPDRAQRAPVRHRSAQPHRRGAPRRAGPRPLHRVVRPPGLIDGWCERGPTRRTSGAPLWARVPRAFGDQPGLKPTIGRSRRRRCTFAMDRRGVVRPSRSSPRGALDRYQTEGHVGTWAPGPGGTCETCNGSASWP